MTTELHARPLHLYDAKENVYVRWCYYSAENPLGACLRAYYEARCSPVGTVIEVVNVDTGKVVGWCRHAIDGVKTGGDERYFKRKEHA